MLVYNTIPYINKQWSLTVQVPPLHWLVLPISRVHPHSQSADYVTTAVQTSQTPGTCRSEHQSRYGAPVYKIEQKPTINLHSQLYSQKKD